MRSELQTHMLYQKFKTELFYTQKKNHIDTLAAKQQMWADSPFISVESSPEDFPLQPPTFSLARLRPIE